MCADLTLNAIKDHSISHTEQKQSWAARLFRWGIAAWFDRQGWTVEGPPPSERKYVVIAAPHTSNWDFPIFIGIAQRLDVQLSFMGKASLFRWPFGNLMRELGGIAVERSRSTNMVDQMIAEFAARENFMLTIAPEGTRSKSREWKSGFYHIAVGAKVPLVCGFVDYAKKRGGLGQVIWPSGDYEADMAKIAAIYRGYTPKHPDRATKA